MVNRFEKANDGWVRPINIHIIVDFKFLQLMPQSQQSAVTASEGSVTVSVHDAVDRM